jgi:hypothetical protein
MEAIDHGEARMLPSDVVCRPPPRQVSRARSFIIRGRDGPAPQTEREVGLLTLPADA